MVLNNIKNILEQKNISIRKMAMDLSYDYSNAYKMVNKKDISYQPIGRLIEVSDYLGVNIEKLYK